MPHQDLSYALAANNPMEITFWAGNTSNASKQLIVNIASVAGTSGKIECVFNIPANLPLMPYTVRGKTNGLWNSFRIHFWNASSDGLPALIMTGANVQYKPSLSVTGTECIIPNAPALLTPVNGSQNVVRPTFTWAAVAGTTGYHLRYGTTNPPTGAPISISGGNTTSYTATSDLPTGTIYWQMRSVDGANISDWGPVASFQVNPPVAANTNLVQNGTFDTTTGWYQWGGLDYAIANGYVQLNSKPANWAPLVMDLPYNVPNGAPFEITFKVRNIGTTDKRIGVGVGGAFDSGDYWAGGVLCSSAGTFIIPPTSDYLTYTIRGRAGQSLPRLRLHFDSPELETAINLRIDDVVVQYKPSLSVTTTECIPPVSPITPTWTPSITPSLTPTPITPTATFTWTPSITPSLTFTPIPTALNPSIQGLTHEIE